MSQDKRETPGHAPRRAVRASGHEMKARPSHPLPMLPGLSDRLICTGGGVLDWGWAGMGWGVSGPRRTLGRSEAGFAGQNAGHRADACTENGGGYGSSASRVQRAASQRSGGVRASEPQRLQRRAGRADRPTGPACRNASQTPTYPPAPCRARVRLRLGLALLAGAGASLGLGCSLERGGCAGTAAGLERRRWDVGTTERLLHAYQTSNRRRTESHGKPGLLGSHLSPSTILCSSVRAPSHPGGGS